MMQVIQQTDEEKMAMYMKLPKKQIAEMLINCNNIIAARTQAKNCVIPAVSGSAWEHKLVGKNIHSVFTWCKDCHGTGCNVPFNNECGNCGSKNTVRYYDKETIDLLF